MPAKKQKNTQTPPTQQFVDVREVKNGIVVLKNGALRKVILVDGLNFNLKSEEEQNLIISGYQNLLNSLDFSLQILVHTRKLNIDGYIEDLRERMENTEDEGESQQISEYINFIESLIEGNEVMVKSFFVVIPYEAVSLPLPSSKHKGGAPKAEEGAEQEETLETPQRERDRLEERVDKVISGLRQIGLRAVALEDNELRELYYNFYNPTTIEQGNEKVAERGKKKTSGEADIVASGSIEVTPLNIKVDDKFARTLFILDYPRFLSSGWFSDIINFPGLIDVSFFIHPEETNIALKNLRRKSAQFESQILANQEKGLVRDPALETAYQDVESLRDALQQATERLFLVGVYITIYADTASELNKLESQINSILESRLVDVRSADFEQIKGWQSTMPLGIDSLDINKSLNTGPISSFFPFVSLDLTSDSGILYGINRSNSTLIIFDRFSLENANMVVFAKSGSGKSYATKLEVIRSLMLGTNYIIIDPENEYQSLAETLGGTYIKISLNSGSHINPFDIPIVPADEDPGEVLRSHVVNLTGLLKLMLGKITDEEEALLDQALIETYAVRDITPGRDFTKATPPLLEDLVGVLRGLQGGEEMATRLLRFVKGSYSGFTNVPTNVDIQNRLIVFSVRDLEDELRPVAMYIILNFIWNAIRADIRKRIMIIDEAWWLMKYPDSASFLFGLAKRARKYYLGLTTITQDVEDFLNSPYGRPIITNSSLQLLLKQAPATIDTTGKAFNLTDVEKNYLLEADVGTGLFIAGLKRAAIQIVASLNEDALITTNPNKTGEDADDAEENKETK
ncbi:MAG: ATP-binding protein [Patescibacteria group bacterium]|nr:ATP-binding protein [Patescibacteria group bacterium]